MARRFVLFITFAPFIAIGIGLVVAGFRSPPSPMMAPGFPLSWFFYIMGGGFLAMSFIMLSGFVIVGNAKRKKLENLMENGQQGEAIIIGLEDTGVMINNNPRIKLSLEVQLEGHAPYQVQKTMVVPLIRLSQVQVGSKVPVLVDPSEPHNPAKLGLLLN
ncbi:MAG: SHOCT domain-containing protein [Chloroflexi bacterium AL-W]|nr:SHOCT domain-containing protein [Chloroflexi bacterium AL-N1]NOK70421.1 SHOCT domain-containing protein [Chloroflexi bacterium AL-N10]NOK78220.1 SHOCT domain-containing protein [Chloroflexi bacterium AL-N5]NOK85319.1 SHOCT domain-containing protein [Chloroflexi bacterium AL-W]NOK92084.1 SHOCT domain-containing protein [Chloroflexi bacterium AL-N15]